MARTQYPYVNDETGVIGFCREIQRIRESEDVPDFTNLPQRFVTGRSSTRVPSGPSDVLASDQVGDIVNDATFEYKLVDTGGGTLLWDRRALDTAW